jgi:hypothetical protein
MPSQGHESSDKKASELSSPPANVVEHEYAPADYAFGYPYGRTSPLGPSDAVNHPSHYGGDTVYEVIKVIEAWGLGFNLGNTVKYIGRPGKGNYLEDLKKARFYLDREIANREAGK